MQKLKPINIESDVILIHPLRRMDMARISDIENDIYEILSDNNSTKYIPEKRLSTRKTATDRVFGFVMGYQTSTSYAHFITDKRTQKVIGLIDIISPERAKQSYKIDKYDWMIEYYLHKDYCGQGIMTGIVGAICQRLKGQGINTIAAICDRNNQASIRVLEKVGFRKTKSFDIKQDYFEL